MENEKIKEAAEKMLTQAIGYNIESIKANAKWDNGHNQDDIRNAFRWADIRDAYLNCYYYITGNNVDWNDLPRDEEALKTWQLEKLPKFYFTFGTDRLFPYQKGWVEVQAGNGDEALAIFNSHFPPRRPGSNTANCAFIYSQEQFERTSMFLEPGSWGGCHEVLYDYAE